MSAKQTPAGARRPQDGEQDETPQVVNLVTSNVHEVHADLVRLHQSVARRVEAEETDLHQSSVAQVAASRITAHESAIGMAQAGEIQAANSSIGAARAEIATINGNAGVIFAGTARLQNTCAGLMAGREVHAERIKTLVLFSTHVEGEVHTTMSTRDAILAGSLGGLLIGLAMLLGRFLFRSD